MSRTISIGTAARPSAWSDRAVVGVGLVARVDPGREQHRHAQDDRDLHELGGLEREAAADHDPRVRAVDRGAERGEHQQDQEDREAVQDRHGGAQGAVAEPDRADHQGEADAGVQQVPDQEVVRVALVELGAVAGRRVDEGRADQGERDGREQYRPVEPAGQRVAGEQPRPAGALGPVPGDGEAVRAGHVGVLRLLRSGAVRRASVGLSRSCAAGVAVAGATVPRRRRSSPSAAAASPSSAAPARSLAGPCRSSGRRSSRPCWIFGRLFCGRGQQRLLLVDRAVLGDAVQRVVDACARRGPRRRSPYRPGRSS